MEEEKVVKKDFHIENTFKGIFTTLFGCVLMAVALYGYLVNEPFGEGSEKISPSAAIIIGILGFALLFMRDQVPVFITKFISKKTE